MANEQTLNRYPHDKIQDYESIESIET
jgi:hypothetical protein